MSHRGKPWGEGKEAAKHPEEVVTLERRRSPGCDVERPALLGPGTLGFTRSTADRRTRGKQHPGPVRTDSLTNQWTARPPTLYTSPRCEQGPQTTREHAKLRPMPVVIGDAQ